MAAPTMWSKNALVAISKLDGTDIDFQTIIDTIDIDEGDKDITLISNVGGGCMIKEEPQGLTTVTFENFPISVSTLLGFSQHFDGGTWNTTDPFSASANINMDDFRVTILWTDDSSVTGANDTVSTTTAAHYAYRWYATACKLTSLKKSFTDKALKMTAQFKVAPFTKSGTAQITEHSLDGTTTSVITALASYT